MRMVAVVLGGGVGQRLGAGMPKQLLTLGGRTLIEWCVAAFDQAPGIDEILVVMARGYTGQVEALLAGAGPAGAGYRKVTAVIEGGVTRPDSTRVALAAIAARRPGAAERRRRRRQRGRLRRAAARRRPAAGGPADHRGLRGRARGARRGRGGGARLGHHGDHRERRDALGTAAGEAVPLPDPAVLPAFRDHPRAPAGRGRPGFAPTDDCGVVLRYLPATAVHIVPGSERNIKVTYAQDLALAEALLRGQLRTACLTRVRPNSQMSPLPRLASSSTSPNASVNSFTSASPIISGGISLITSM